MKIEFRRQFVHVVLGLVFIALMYFLEFNQAVLTIGVISLAGFVLSLLIKKGLVKSSLLDSIIGAVTRKHEIRITGEPALWFALGTMLTILFFPVKSIVIGALIVLTFGDATSTIVGKKLGKIRLKGNRTFEGSIAGIIIATLLLTPFFSLQTAFIAAFLGMLSEYFPFNDNVTMPLVAAIVLAILL